MTAPRVRSVESSHIGDLLRIAELTNLNHWSAESYLDELKNPNSIFLRIESDDNSTLGFIVGRIVPAADNAEAIDADIYNIGVEPDQQHSGCGQSVFDAFCEQCCAKNVRSIWLEVRESNAPAVNFYLKNGFIAVDVRKGFYADPTENALVMRKMLV